MKRKKFTSTSSDESSSDEALIIVKKKKKKNKKTGLFDFRIEKCEFCDEVFFSSYALLVHNAKHIIVPLQPFVKCTCGRYFSTQEDLQHHNEQEHHINTVPNLNALLDKKSHLELLEDLTDTRKLVVKCEDNLKEIITVRFNNQGVTKNNAELTFLNETNECSNEEIKPEEFLVKCEENLEEIITAKYNNQSATENNAELTFFDEANEESSNKTDDLFVKCEDNLEEMITARKQHLEKIIHTKAVVQCDASLSELLKHSMSEDDSVELKLEKDIDLDATLKLETIEDEADLTVNNGPISNFKSKLVFEDDFEEFEDDIIQLDSYAKSDSEFKVCSVDIDQTDMEQDKYESVHYDQLMLSGAYKCWKCSRTFPNRYNLIIHETGHMSTKRKKPIVCKKCDYYIAGNHFTLKKHITRAHADDPRKPKVLPLKTCTECHLPYYNLDRHLLNYHFIYVCSLCSSRFRTEPERITHSNICKGKNIKQDNEVFKLIKVCELCFSFFKNTQKFRYKQKGVYSRDGLRTSCERCDKPFFELKLVEMSRKLCCREYGKKQITTTNESRLKNFQNRLKMINKMNRV